MTAIVDLGTLKTAVQRECQRVGHAGFTAELPRLIQASEDLIFNGTAQTSPVRIIGMETDADLTFTSGTATTPAGFLEQVRLYWQSDFNNVPQYVTPDEFYSRRYTGSGWGYISLYTVEGASVLISPAATGTGKLRYYARPAAMSADPDTNSILTSASTVYYHAVCYEAFKYLRNDEKAAEHLASFASAVRGLEVANERKRTGGRALRPMIRQARV